MKTQQKISPDAAKSMYRIFEKHANFSNAAVIIMMLSILNCKLIMKNGLFYLPLRDAFHRLLRQVTFPVDFAFYYLIMFF